MPVSKEFADELMRTRAERREWRGHDRTLHDEDQGVRVGIGERPRSNLKYSEIDDDYDLAIANPDTASG